MQSKVSLAVIVLLTVSVLPARASGFDDKPIDQESIDALQAKMLPAKTTTDPVTGLLFFPIPKKKAKDLDLVYTSPLGKLHIKFR